MLMVAGGWMWLVLGFALMEGKLAHHLPHGKFWHVTDLHYNDSYDGVWCRDPPCPLGVYGRDSSWTLVSAAIEAMKGVPVDFILWTGDSVAHFKSDEITEQGKMKMLKDVTEALSKQFPNTPVFPALGNNDIYPTNDYPPGPTSLYTSAAELWEDWIGEEQMENFRKGGYYTRQLPWRGVRMVVLNTNLYASSDPDTHTAHDPAGQLQWLAQVLDSAQQHHEKVILGAHIAPGFSNGGAMWYQERFVVDFNNILTKYSDVIKAMHFGHEHVDGFKVFPDASGEASIPLFLAPAVTPNSRNNPGLHLVTFDTGTADHLDITQYRLDLSKGDTTFSKMSSHTQKYGVKDVTAASLDKLITEMEKDSALLEEYYSYASGDANKGSPCSDSCKKKILCGFRKFTREAFDACVQD